MLEGRWKMEELFFLHYYILDDKTLLYVDGCIKADDTERTVAVQHYDLCDCDVRDESVNVANVLAFRFAFLGSIKTSYLVSVDADFLLLVPIVVID